MFRTLFISLFLIFIFIPLDIFRKNIHNKEVKNELDTQLSFLILDSPEDIVALIEEHPEFKPYISTSMICVRMWKG